MVNKIHYRWDFFGLSTDTKPTPEDSPKVVDGSTFYESDTSKLFVFYKDTWYERKPLGEGGGGGESSDETDYGVVYYYDNYIASINNIYGEECTPTIENMSLFSQFASKNSDSSNFYFDFQFEQGMGWMFRGVYEEAYYTTEQLLDEVGIKVTDFDESTADFGMITIEGEISVDPSYPPKRKVLNSVEEYNSLSSSSSEHIVPLNSIVKFVFGKSVTNIPDSFLQDAQVLENIETKYSTGVLSIGTYVFMRLPSLQPCTIEFPEVTTIGHSFLSGNSTFYGVVNLPKVKTIGNGCFTICASMPKMPEVESIGERFMAGSKVTNIDFGNMPKLKTLGSSAFAESAVHSVNLMNSQLQNLVSIETGFCKDCSYLGTVSIDNTAIINKISADSSNNPSFATYLSYNPSNSSRGLSYRGGMYFSGSSDVKTALIAKFPNYNGSYIWRKWVN